MDNDASRWRFRRGRAPVFALALAALGARCGLASRTALLLIGTLAGVMPVSGRAAGDPFRSAVESFEQGRYRQAVAELRELVERDPNHADALLYLGRASLELDSPDEAIRWLEQAVALRPESSDVHHRLGEAYGLKARTANLLSRPSHVRRTRAELLRAVELDPRNLEARKTLILFHLEAPGLLGGSFAKAHEQAAAIERIDPAAGLLQRALILEAEDEPSEAEKAYRQGIASHPPVVDFRVGLGQLLERQERWDEAFAVFEELAQLPDGRMVAYLKIGHAAALSGRNLTRGIDCLNQYLASPPAAAGMPPLAQVLFRLGQLQQKTGRSDLARAAFARALELDPNHEEARKALKGAS